MRAIQVDRFGGPEVLTPRQVPEPVPGPGQSLITVEAAGVNFADALQAEGSYEGADQLPYVPGREVVGRTADGRRVAALTRGGYAELALADDTKTIDVPEELPAGQVLALLMQGLTAWHLLRTAARLQPGESVVVHSAAGGVGSLAVQLAREFGASWVGAEVSTSAKRELALGLGADAVVEYPLDKPVDVVLDAVGGRLFDEGLGSLAVSGRLVTYGNASRAGFTPLDPARLSRLGASVVGFWLRPVLARPGGFTEPLQELFSLTGQGRLRPVAGAEYPLAEAGRAHADLLARRTMGKVILRP
ncbi:quinone oxidoreductase family protein [Streptomyces lanatus]|uniref:Zinc-binding dehydrogenase n=1 Tax=Streptomyces lanatus TaxID=66900 RepID=A0ABV1Y3X4_9ACTN|nr:zinc-binding dehydrogenase [Streptomyces lanatus]GHH27678.1 NADPH:quinone reductase [Streptomyces lanatus]